MNGEDKYFDEWLTNTPIDWWNDGRNRLNIIIRVVNEWTINGADKDQAAKILRNVDMGLQTFAKRDGGSGWEEELKGMRSYIKNRCGLEEVEDD